VSSTGLTFNSTVYSTNLGKGGGVYVGQGGFFNATDFTCHHMASLSGACLYLFKVRAMAENQRTPPTS
jgi:hypothetical protein